MKKLAGIFVAAILVAPVCLAQTKETIPKAPAATPKPIVVAPADAKWRDLPSNLMVGTPSVAMGGELHVAVLEGDPAKAASAYSVLLSCSDGVKIAPVVCQNLIRAGNGSIRPCLSLKKSPNSVRSSSSNAKFSRDRNPAYARAA